MAEVNFSIPTAEGTKTNARLVWDEENPLDLVLLARTKDEQWVDVDHYEEIFTLPNGDNASISVNISETRETFSDDSSEATAPQD